MKRTTPYSPVRRHALAAIAASTWLFADRAAAQAAPSLVIATGNYLGVADPLLEIADRLTAELARRSGFKLTLQQLPATRANEMANDGEIDGVIGRVIEVTARYPNLEALPTPVGKLQIAIYAARPEIARMSRIELKRLPVGTLRGLVVTMKHSAGMTVSETSGLDSAFEMLAGKRVDMLMLNYVGATFYLQQHPGVSVVRWPYAWADEPMYLMLNRKHAALRPALAEALAQIKRDGLIDRYYEEALRRAGIEYLPPEPAAR